ncbi:MAG: glutaredoxin [Nitrospirales bacterium]|nr:MAG: glutaredoxin [Nitrospirales bacterium]
MLDLYQFENCPYSQKVRQKLSELEIDYILRNVSEEKSNRTRLLKISGQDAVPTLIDSVGNTMIAGDDAKIIAYLENEYLPK